jgi:hypothetical protein
MKAPKTKRKKIQLQQKTQVLKLGFFGQPGVADGARTHDNRNHNPGLYQLSYSHREAEIIA